MTLNREQRDLCKNQQELFEYAALKGVNIKQFTYAFLTSEFCNRSLDKPYSVDHSADIMNWLEFLEKDCPLIPDKGNKNLMSKSVAGWIGFTYRQIQIFTRMNSRDIANAIPVERMIIAYPGLHTVDEDMAAEILIENFKLKTKN